MAWSQNALDFREYVRKRYGPFADDAAFEQFVKRFPTAMEKEG